MAPLPWLWEVKGEPGKSLSTCRARLFSLFVLTVDAPDPF